METKKERFARITEARIRKITDMLRLLGNCSNKINYEYSEADVGKIFDALDKEVSKARKRFESEGIAFRLNDEEIV